MVFCRSSIRTDENYKSQATLLGKALAEQHIELVYGSANGGLMGAVADGVLALGGKVIGVLPHFLKSKEIAHENLTDLLDTTKHYAAPTVGKWITEETI